LLSPFVFCRGTCPEPEAIISGFDDMAVMGWAIEQGRRHFGIAEDPAQSLKLRFVVITTLARSCATTLSAAQSPGSKVGPITPSAG